MIKFTVIDLLVSHFMTTLNILVANVQVRFVPNSCYSLSSQLVGGGEEEAIGCASIICVV